MSGVPNRKKILNEDLRNQTIDVAAALAKLRNLTIGLDMDLTEALAMPNKRKAADIAAREGITIDESMAAWLERVAEKVSDYAAAYQRVRDSLDLG